MKLKGNAVFFDDKRLMDAVGKGERRALSKWGSFVRRTARQSIRKRKKPSAPGSPPSSHTGALRRNIFFAYDKKTRSCVVGPVLAGSMSGAPKVLEYGGTATIGKLSKQRTFRIGQSAPIREVPNGSGGTRFIWARISTRAQADRAAALYYRRNKKRTVRVKARPFMRPALVANLSVGAQCFKDCVK